MIKENGVVDKSVLYFCTLAAAALRLLIYLVRFLNFALIKAR